MSGQAILLMGPTASGKTEIAIRLCKRFPLEIISVDSALVYRGMDIGTAKPDAQILARTPHRLIDIRDPEQSYSAGDFVREAREEMVRIHAAGHVPLLAGGTMMYFRALTGGIAELPEADPAVRAELDADARREGWPALHARLAACDPDAARRIEPRDKQRIQRALEVFLISGRPLTEWQRESETADDSIDYLKIALECADRAILHERIEQRLDRMLDQGFVDEIKRLMARPGLERDAPAMRAVGYRQFWSYLAGQCSMEEARYRALVATRQLAKRQLTWLRSEPNLHVFDPLDPGAIDAISALCCDTIFERLG